MENSREFINSITDGENLEAESHFSSAMTDKVGAALELRRIELASDSVEEGISIRQKELQDPTGNDPADDKKLRVKRYKNKFHFNDKAANESLGQEVRDTALMRKAGQGDKNKEAKLIKKTTKIMKDTSTGIGQGMHSAKGRAARENPALYKKAMSNPKAKKYMSDLEQRHGQRELDIGSKSIAKHRDKDNAPDKVKRNSRTKEFSDNDSENMQ